MRVISFFTAFLFFCGSQSFAAAGICGKIDLPKMSNAEIESLVSALDVGAGRLSVSREQCGLPGERLNICSSCVKENSERLMRQLRPILYEAQHRAWHSEWHRIRLIQDHKHMPAEFIREHGSGGSLAGEDFFFMHRQMIKMVQVELAAAGLGCIAPWSKVPETIFDSQWPAPRASQANLEETAAMEKGLSNLRTLERNIRSPEKLRKMTLNQLGNWLDASLHMRLHSFYASSAQCSPEAQAQNTCDNLIPPETSPLNPHFWKIHGLVEEILGDWLKAHGYSRIEKNCEGQVDCYQWQGTWLGK